jgi:hypothetical protein
VLEKPYSKLLSVNTDIRQAIFKKIGKNYFLGTLKTTEEIKEQDPDPDPCPYQNVTNPEPWNLGKQVYR